MRSLSRIVTGLFLGLPTYFLRDFASLQAKRPLARGIVLTAAFAALVTTAIWISEYSPPFPTVAPWLIWGQRLIIGAFCLLVNQMLFSIGIGIAAWVTLALYRRLKRP
jgi:hypothetical protein